MSEVELHHLVVFSFGGERYALPIAAVREIIRYTRPRSVESDLPGVQGVIGLRGKVIPVVDLAVGDGRDPGNILIVENSAGHIGVVVDAVDEVRTVSADELEDVPSTHCTIAKLDDRLVVLVEPESLTAAA